MPESFADGRPLVGMKSRERQTDRRESPAFSADVAQNKGTSRFSPVRTRKSMLLKCNELIDLRGESEAKKRGTPENEDISTDVYENKGQKILHSWLL
jgi:hypothetical protein